MRLRMIDLRNARKYLIVSVLLVLLTFVFGCNEVTDDNEKKAGFKKNSESVKDVAPEVVKKVSEVEDAVAAPVTDLTLYFANANGDRLIRTVVEIEKTESVAKAAMERLISGPSIAGRYRSVPVGTRLINISIDAGIASVDLSKEFIDGHNGGSAEEMMSVYSIVNTLTEFSSIDAVIFLVEGKKIEAITGHLDLSEPVKRREDLIGT